MSNVVVNEQDWRDALRHRTACLCSGITHPKYLPELMALANAASMRKGPNGRALKIVLDRLTNKDYRRLCRSCHWKLDRKIGNIKHMRRKRQRRESQ